MVKTEIDLQMLWIVIGSDPTLTTWIVFSATWNSPLMPAFNLISVIPCLLTRTASSALHVGESKKSSMFEFEVSDDRMSSKFLSNGPRDALLLPNRSKIICARYSFLSSDAISVDGDSHLRPRYSLVLKVCWTESQTLQNVANEIVLCSLIIGFESLCFESQLRKSRINWLAR